MIRLILVDDEPAVREGLRMRLSLEPDLTIVGEAGDGTTGLALAAALQPDVVVLDLGMPGIGIVETIGALREIAAGSAIIVHSIHDDAANRDLALEAGANAYIPKDIVLDELLDAIRRKAAPD